MAFAHEHDHGRADIGWELQAGEIVDITKPANGETRNQGGDTQAKDREGAPRALLYAAGARGCAKALRGR